MEILSNIWNILTTENEMITKIINAPTVIIELWLLFQLATCILKIKYNKKQEILSISSLTNEFFLPGPFNVFINYLIMFIIIRLLLKTNIIQTLLAIIIPTVIIALVATLTLNPTLKIMRITSVELNAFPIYTMIYQIVLYSLTFLFLYLLKSIKINLVLIDNINKHNKYIILLNLLLGLVTLCTQSILTYYYINILPIAITILNFILLLSYFSISFYSLTRIMKLQITTENLETAENYNETLTYLYDNVKAFKHDFDNMVFVIGGFIENNDINKLKKYYKNLEKDCERVNNIALLNPKLINNSGVYNLLMSKYKKASEYNVEIKLEYFFDLEKLNMPIYEFSRILGILLDNALEAAKDSKEKQIHILFRDSQRNNTQIISIENSFSNKDVDTSAIFEKGKTSKENHTGMGLWEVKHILNRNNNVNLITVKDENYFKQSIEIYY